MAYRTTDEAVRGIIELDDDFDTDPFIETANMVVTDNCTSSGYSDEKLELIERWVSAHFCCVRDPRTRMESVKGITETFEGTSGQKFSSTRYGQQALILDNAGNLKALDKGAGGKPTIKHIGGAVDTVWVA